MVGTNGQGIEELRRRFADWRRTRARGTRIPEALWQTAVEAARERGVHRISKQLGVDYYSLARRLNGKTRAATRACKTGGYAVLSFGYHLRNASSSSPLRTAARTWRRRCAPSRLHLICCFLTNRLATRRFTVDSASAVEIALPLRYAAA